jgi:gliding motility-associated-like protein
MRLLFYARSFALAILLFLVSSHAQGQIPATINGAGAWSASGTGTGSVVFATGSCYTVTVQAWGGGGGGGGGTNGGAAGGGTGGGYAQGVVTLPPGTYDFNAGAGGAAGTPGGAGGAGGSSWFNGTPTTNNNTTGAFINANGGTGGPGANNNGTAGQATVGTGTFGTGVTDTVSFSGGKSGTSVSGGSGGGGASGGGGGAGSGGNGGNGGAGANGSEDLGICDVGAGGGGGGGGGSTGNGGAGTVGAATGTGNGGAAGTAGAGGGSAGGKGGNGLCGGGNGPGVTSGSSGTQGGGGGGGGGDNATGGNGGAYGGGGGGGEAAGNDMDGGPGGKGNLTITVALLPPPTATAGPALAAICQGATSAIMNGSVSAGATALWTGGAGTWTDATDPVNATYTASATETGTITLTLTATSACGTGTATKTITVNPTPPAPTVTSPVTYCQNATAVPLTATGTNLLWYTAATGGTGSGTAPTPSTTTTGSTIYYVSQTQTGCESPRSAITVTIDPTPTSTFTVSSPTVCEGVNDNITYTGSAPAGATYTWDFAGGAIVSGTGQGPYVVSWSTSGTMNVTLSVTQGTCTSSVTTVVVTVNATPVLTVSPDVSICAGSGTTLTASGATTYSWSPAAGLSATTGPSVTATPAATTTYTVTGTTSGCTASASVDVTVNPEPTSTFTVSSPTVCEGVNDNITYTGSAPAGATYTWDFAGGTIVAGTGQGPYVVSWSTSGAMNVTLSVTQGTCTSTVTTVPVTVNATPVLATNPNAVICIGSSATLTASGATTYTWSPGATLSSTTGSSVTATPATTTTYTVVGTTSGCTASALDTVTVSPLPTSAFTVSSATVCTGVNDTVTYTGNAPTSATYTWNFAGGAIVSGAGQGPYAVNWNSAGSLNITLVVSIGTCTSPTTTVPVTVNATPAVTVSPDVAICAGSSTTLTANGATDYVWSPAAGLSATTGASVTASPAATTPYTVTGTTSGCSNTATVNVTVNPVPTATFTADAAVCAGVNDNITYTGSAGIADTYTWNFDGGNIVSGSGQGPYAINWATAGSYTVSLAVTENGCTSAPYSLPVTVNAAPVSVAGQPVSFCSGDSAMLGGAATAGYTYTWSPATGLSDATIANPEADMTNTGSSVITTTYTVTTTDNGCTSTASVSVSVTPAPVAAFAVPAGQCLSGNSFSFQAGGSYLPSATFEWAFGATATPATSVSANQAVAYSSAGINTVTLAITQNGCSNTFTAQDTVYAMPASSLSADSTNGCENFNACFNANSTSTNSTYQWTFGDGGTSALQNPCHTYAAPGTYTVSLSATSANGCAYDTTINNMITILADPAAAFIPTDATLQLPQSELSLTNQSKNATSYAWNFGNMTTSAETSPTATFTAPGTDTVTLVAYNAIGCSDTARHTVIVLGEDTLYIPNAFTPNGNGINDYFEVFGNKENWKLLHVTIFDRWGEKVFESDDLYFQWDGTYRGQKLEPGVLVYEMTIVFQNEQQGHKYKGSITLIR